MSSPTRHNRAKLNHLLNRWPEGAVATYGWLAQQGISRQLASTYKRSNWIVTVGNGAFARTGEKIDWTGGLYAVQQELGCTIHVAAKTALAQQGYAHFLPLGEGSPIWLLGQPGERLPTWFHRAPWGKRVQYSTAALWPDKVQGTLGMTERTVSRLNLRVATAERAMFEVLHFVPQRQSFEEARLLMEGLFSLRPRLVQSLLEACAFVKVKRLFLALAESCGHSWLTKLDLPKVTLGAGKRALVSGGRLHPKYQITVPAEFLSGSKPGETP